MYQFFVILASCPSPSSFSKTQKKYQYFCTYHKKKGRDSVVTTWQKWDLSVLGEVVSVAFNLVGSADLYGDWGLNAPAYFAYDDIAVRFDKNDQTALFNSPTTSFPNSRKVLHNGQLLIFRNGKTYSIMGQNYRSSKVPSE